MILLVLDMTLSTAWWWTLAVVLAVGLVVLVVLLGAKWGRWALVDRIPPIKMGDGTQLAAVERLETRVWTRRAALRVGDRWGWQAVKYRPWRQRHPR
jgi:hypothetical protein